MGHAADPVHALWDAVGLTPEPWNGMYRGAYVDICPPSLAGETVPDGTPTYLRRPVTPTLGSPQPPWQPVRPDLPSVYVTLGTVLDGVRRASPPSRRSRRRGLQRPDDDRPRRRSGVTRAMAGERDGRAFRATGGCAPHCSVVVSHGGSGTTYGALAHGLPLLMLPHGADQFDNAAAARAAGVAETLMPPEIEPAAIRVAVEALLDDAGLCGAGTGDRSRDRRHAGLRAVAAALAESA